MTRGQEFPVDMDFFSLARRQSAKALARQLTKDTLSEFHHISLNSILTNDEHLRHLGTWWDRLCHDVEELAAVGETEEMLKSLSQV